MSTIEPLLERFRRRDRTALARLLTLIARGEQREAIRAASPAIRVPPGSWPSPATGA